MRYDRSASVEAINAAFSNMQSRGLVNIGISFVKLNSEGHERIAIALIGVRPSDINRTDWKKRSHTYMFLNDQGCDRGEGFALFAIFEAPSVEGCWASELEWPHQVEEGYLSWTLAVSA